MRTTGNRLTTIGPIPPASDVSPDGPGRVLYSARWRLQSFRQTRQGDRVQGRTPRTGYAKELEERRWYSLELAESGPGGKPKGILQRDGDTLGPELERYLVRIEPIPSDALENLKRLHSWEALQKPSPQAADINQNVLFVGVMEVGQGGCNAIYGPSGRPFLY